jgi:type II secretory pathway pseudopilin PulG
MAKAVLATIVTSTKKDTLLEVVLDQTTTAKTTIELRQLSWGEGLGWCPQQSLQLSTEEAQALLDSLRITRRHWQEQRTQQSGTVVPFPIGASLARTHPAHKSSSSRKKKTGETPKAPPVTPTQTIASHCSTETI